MTLGRNSFSRPQFILIISTILLSNLTTAIDASLSSSSHVVVASAFNKANLASTPVNAFLLTSTTLQPLYARISDHTGRKIPYVVSSACFLTGIAVSATSDTWTGLIVGRAISGAGCAGLLTMGSITLTDVVGVEKRGYYQSMNYVVYGGGSALGSAMGGYLVDSFSWKAVYLMQIPLASIATTLLVLVMPSQSKFHDITNTKSAANRISMRKFDYAGSLCLVACLGLLYAFLTLGGNVLPWSDFRVVLSGCLFLGFLCLFIHVEKAAELPVLPIDILLTKPIRNLEIIGFLFPTIHYMIMYNISVFFQTCLLESAEQASFRLVIPSISYTIISAVTGIIIARTKTPVYTLRTSQYLLLSGSLGLFILACQSDKMGISNIVYAVALALPSLGAGMMAPSAVLALLNAASKEDHASVNGGFIMVRSLGVFVAVAVSTTTLQNSFWASVNDHEYDEVTKSILRDISGNVELISSLDEDVQSQVINAYSNSFIVLFGICTLLACLICINLSNIRLQNFDDQTSQYSTLGNKESELDDLSRVTDDED